MTGLFIELYLDEDVDILVADLVRARGFGAVTTREAGQLGKSDAEQLAYTVSRGMTLLPHNRVDFELLAQTYASTGRSHHGIVIAVGRQPYELARRLLVVLDRLTADEMHDQVRYI